MDLINATRLLVGHTLALHRTGRELLVIAIKATFSMPAEQGARLQLHDQQLPLTMSDVFFGAPGLSAPRYEVDFAPRKPLCDVLLNGQAHAPDGRPTQRVVVKLQIGNWQKSFAVVGDRVWFTDGGPRATAAVPFTEMPIHYDRAFGGADLSHEDPAQHAAFAANPSGAGYRKHLESQWLDGTALPNTEELTVPVENPAGEYRPMSFGIIGRHWESRVQYAGTYDQNWLDNIFPFLPTDFDERYFQAAPADQQLPAPLGEQTVTLTNLTPEGSTSFVLPHFEAPVVIVPHSGPREELHAVADTILIEPDERRVTMTWRVTRPLKRNIFEIAQVVVGRKGPEWWQQKGRLAFPIPVVMEVAKAKAAAKA
jgi:hypothetical protein